MEKWEDINDYKGFYQISTIGRVKSLERLIKRPKYGNFMQKERILSGNVDKSGYESVLLVKNTRKKKFLVHRLVAIHFLKNPKDHKYVNHLDAKRDNNDVLNLEWCTQSENKKHSYNLGLSDKKGIKHHNTKFTYNDVFNIRELHKSGLTQKEISEKYKVHKATIWHIVNNKTWNYDLEKIR